MPKGNWSLFLAVAILLTSCGRNHPAIAPVRHRPEVRRVAPPPPIPLLSGPGPVARVVYLTVDDGPDPRYTPEVLQILHRYQVPATFFLVGTRILAAPTVAREIYDDGEAIGNHSFDHIYKHLYHTPLGFLWDVQSDQAVLEKVVGFRPVLFRAPGGTVGNFVPQDYRILAALKLHLVGWNVDAGDARWPRPTPQAIVNRVFRQLQRRPYLWSHSMILMHDSNPETVRALPAIIRLLQANGFRFAKVTPATPPAW